MVLTHKSGKLLSVLMSNIRRHSKRWKTLQPKPSKINIHEHNTNANELRIMISKTRQTIRSSCSACSSSAPAKTSTKLVPSPHSCSCCCDANTSIFAAGCCTYIIKNYCKILDIKCTQFSIGMLKLVAIQSKLVTNQLLFHDVIDGNVIKSGQLKGDMQRFFTKLMKK